MTVCKWPVRENVKNISSPSSQRRTGYATALMYRACLMILELFAMQLNEGCSLTAPPKALKLYFCAVEAGIHLCFLFIMCISKRTAACKAFTGNFELQQLWLRSYWRHQDGLFLDGTARRSYQDSMFSLPLGQKRQKSRLPEKALASEDWHYSESTQYQTWAIGESSKGFVSSSKHQTGSYEIVCYSS